LTRSLAERVILSNAKDLFHSRLTALGRARVVLLRAVMRALSFSVSIRAAQIFLRCLS